VFLFGGSLFDSLVTVTHAAGGRVSSAIMSVRLLIRAFVCFFLHDISKTDAARITKLDTDMVHHESWKLVYFEIKGQRSRSRGTKNASVHVGLQKERNIDVCCKPASRPRGRC